MDNQTKTSQTILFIEDEATLHKTFEDALTKEGYTLISALDGETGVRLAKEKKPDLILLDLILPGINGIEVLRELKNIPETQHIPVIVLSNSEDMESIQAAIDLGAQTYLVKINYKLEEVIQKIRDALQSAE